MISILIPVYNYNVVPLVKEMHKQTVALQIPFEIIVFDDHSTNLCVESANRESESLAEVTYIRASSNKGRSATRNVLANAARYKWLLFLDADVFPSSPNFVRNYTEYAGQADLIFGGIVYEKEKPAQNTLRWKYGSSRESQTVAQRNKKPFISIISQGFLIRKSLFLKANDLLENRYGLDALFTSNLKNLGATVLHIDNPLIHKGLENNEKFMEKSVKAVRSLVFLAEKGRIPEDHYTIQKAALKLKKYRLTNVFLKCTAFFENQMKKNLLSSNPSLTVFDIYRLRILLSNLN